MVIRSDNVASLTAEGQRALVDFGVKTVIDLRAASELKGSPGPPFSDFQSSSPASSAMGLGIRTLHLPLVDDETASVLNQAPTMPDRYRLMVDRRAAAFGSIFNAIAEADGPVLFHCFAGKDRTGLVAAMLLSLAAVDPVAIGADYAETDAQLAERYEEWLAKATPERLEAMRSELRCPPDWMLSTLAYVVQRWGSVEAYLEVAGVSRANIDLLRAKLA